MLGEVPEEQRVAVQIAAPEHDHAARAHVHARLEEVERLELRRALSPHHDVPATAPERLRVDVGVARRGGEVEEGAGAVPAVPVRRGLDREPAEQLGGDRQRRRHLHHRKVAAAHPELPLVRQLLEGAAVDSGHRFGVRRILPEPAVQLGDAPLAVALGEEVVDRFPQGIDDPPVGVGEVLERRQLAGDRHVPQDHLIPRVLARREEFGEPLGVPQRHRGVVQARVAREYLGLEAQLEDVDQLVAQRVAKIGVAARERQRDAALQELGDAEQSLGRHERQDVGLLEVGMRGVDDQGNAAAHRVVETPRQHAVALLGVSQRHAAELFLLRVEVEIHVVAAQHAPVESAVLHLVLPEVAELGRHRGRPRGAGHEQQGRGPEEIEAAGQRWMLRMRSPCAISGSTRASPTTRANTV